MAIQSFKMSPLWSTCDEICQCKFDFCYIEDAVCLEKMADPIGSLNMGHLDHYFLVKFNPISIIVPYLVSQNMYLFTNVRKNKLNLGKCVRKMHEVGPRSSTLRSV